jgi:type II secretory pathway component PulC
MIKQTSLDLCINLDIIQEDIKETLWSLWLYERAIAENKPPQEKFVKAVSELKEELELLELEFDELVSGEE